MGKLLTKSGMYRGPIIDFGIGCTSSGLPQFMVVVQAQEVYDFDLQTWSPFGEEGDTLTGYLVLFSGKQEPTFHVQNLMHALEWDGKSFVGLARMELMGAGVQFRVIEDLYNDQVRLKIDKLAHWDDIPSLSTINKLAESDLKQMSMQFDALLKKTATAPKAVSAPARAPSAPAPAQTPAQAPKAVGRPAKKATEAPAPVVPTSIPGVVSNRPKAKPKVADIPPPVEAQDPDQIDLPFGDDPDPALDAAQDDATADVPADVSRSMTKQEAWGHCVQLKSKNITVADLTKSWSVAVRGRGKSESEFTGQDWAAICDTVNNECGTF
jgi:hypothetical protein